jgi:hypothetical protein
MLASPFMGLAEVVGYAVGLAALLSIVRSHPTYHREPKNIAVASSIAPLDMDMHMHIDMPMSMRRLLLGLWSLDFVPYVGTFMHHFCGNIPVPQCVTLEGTVRTGPPPK